MSEGLVSRDQVKDFIKGMSLMEAATLVKELEAELGVSSRVANNLRFRRSFGRIRKIIEIPNLIEIQKRSYEEFLQRALAPSERRDSGLQGVFRSVFPIKDFNETASLEFVSFALGEP